MARLVWGQNGSRFYETGVNKGVMYPVTGPGVVWNGLLSVTEKSSGGEIDQYYLDGIKTLATFSAETFSAVIEAYSYPEAFAPSDGVVHLSKGLYLTQQPRQSFGMSYCTRVGNDLLGLEYGYKVNIIYDATVAPSNVDYGTLDRSPVAAAFSWELHAVPRVITGRKPTAHLSIDSTKVSAAAMLSLENILYGTVSVAPRLPTPQEVIDLF